MDEKFVEEVLSRHMKMEKDILKKIDNMEGSDCVGSTKWKLRNIYQDRIKLLEEIHFDLLE